MISTQITHSLQGYPWGNRVARILEAALHAVDPAAAISRYVQRSGANLNIAGDSYNLNDYQHIYIVGVGKAGFPMAARLAHILGDRLTGGIVIVKEGYVDRAGPETPPALKFIEAGHPIPDERGVSGTRQVIQLLKNTTYGDLVLCLISGGGCGLSQECFNARGCPCGWAVEHNEQVHLSCRMLLCSGSHDL